MKLFLGSGAKVFLEQVEIGHQNLLVGMKEYYKDLQGVHVICAIERENGFLQNACQIQAEQDPYYVLLGNSQYFLLLLVHITISFAGARQ